MSSALKSDSEARTANGAAAAKTGSVRARSLPSAIIRPASFADHAGIAALQARNGLEPAPYDQWEAMWTGNPAYIGMKDQWPIGWALESESGGIVGFMGNIPLAYHFQGRPLLATSPCGWAVDPAYRRDSLRMLSRLTSQPGVDLILCTTVGPAAEPIWRLLEAPAPVGTWDRSQFWITNYRGFAESALRAQCAPLPAVLSYPVAAGLFFSDVFHSPSLKLLRAADSCGIEIRREFDSRFDDFWQELRHQNREILMADRSRATLEWHFRSALKAGTIWICTIGDGRRISAYAVFDQQDRSDVGLKRLRITDFQALSGFEWTLAPILERMLAWSRDRRFHMLENSGCWVSRAGLPTLRAPRQRVLRSWSYYYKALDAELGEALKNPSAWAPSAYDGDTSL